MNAVTEIPATETRKAGLVSKFASRFSIEPEKLLSTLKATAFRQRDGQDVTNEQMAALLVVADQYKLNPFTREIYAFPDKGGIVPVVGVDGWSRIINEHPMFDGMDFRQPDVDEKSPLPWLEVVIYRKDRSHPIVVREYFTEVKRDTQPWKSHPRRMLRHKTIIQGARIAFGFAGIYDEDEAERIVAAEKDITPPKPSHPPEYPQETLDANLPDWTKRIQTGKSTAERIIAMIEAKYTLTDEQKAQITAIKSAEQSPPTIDVEKLAERLQNATDLELLDADADLIKSVDDRQRRKSLTATYRARRAELTQGE